MTARRPKGEGSIFQQSDGRWIGRIDLGPDPRTGRRRQRKVTGATKQETSRRLAELRRQFDAGATSAQRPTIAELTERWLTRSTPQRSAAGNAMYRSIVRTHFPPIGNVRVDRLTVRDVEDWLDARSHLTRSTLTKVRSALAQALDYGRRLRVVTVNVARDASLPPVAGESRPRRSLTAEDARRLLVAAAGHRLEAWFQVMLHTGARPGEVAALTWFDVDFDEATIRFVATKTGGRVRVLRVPAVVIEALRTHRRRQNEERLLMGDRWPAEDEQLVFRSDAGTPIDPANARRLVRTVAARAELGHLTPYELRHTHASILSDGGMHAETLADRMGHRDSRTTLVYYRHQIAPVIDAGGDLDLTQPAAG